MGGISGETERVIFKLDGRIVPKARPRMGGGRAYLPANYRNWKYNAIKALLAQSTPINPIERVEVLIELFGSHRGDIDNISGSILDALVQSRILLDDRLSVVRKLTIEHIPGKISGASIVLLISKA